MSSTSASRKPERRGRARPVARADTLSADPAALTRDGRTGTRVGLALGRRHDTPRVTVCRHNLSGRPGARAPPTPRWSGRRRRRGARSNRQSRSRARRGARERRSGRVSGIRPSDRRGPGPVGHRGRNVRSTGRCSYNLRITRRRADSCGLHRSTSQVIRRSGSGVCVCVRAFSLNFAGLRKRTEKKPSFGRLSVGGRGARGRPAGPPGPRRTGGHTTVAARPDSVGAHDGPRARALVVRTRRSARGGSAGPSRNL